MKLKYGKYDDQFYAPEWLVGLFKDIGHDGYSLFGIIFIQWYVGIAWNKKT